MHWYCKNFCHFLSFFTLLMQQHLIHMLDAWADKAEEDDTRLSVYIMFGKHPAYQHRIVVSSKIGMEVVDRRLCFTASSPLLCVDPDPIIPAQHYDELSLQKYLSPRLVIDCLLFNEASKSRYPWDPSGRRMSGQAVECTEFIPWSFSTNIK